MRNSFLYPIPEIEIAVDYLVKASNALLDENIELTSWFIEKADMIEISNFYKLIAGPTNHSIHWQSKQPVSLPKNERIATRMPTFKIEYSIFKRDGWRCRFCGTRVISRKARKILIHRFPDETHWVNKEFERHSSLHCQAASLDHILPHSRGGDSSENNLVTACGPCQFGRNQWTIDEVGFFDPREKTPLIDTWDGLTKIENI